jgi:uncharacterized protein with HEPN domain
MALKWHEMNVREMRECGIPDKAQAYALQIFGEAIRSLAANMPDGVKYESNEFFTLAHDRALADLHKIIGKAVKSLDMEMIRYYPDIVHALSHLVRYSVAHVEYRRSKEVFEAALAELIGA